jgi:putative toxin-antitoxin system antitoxin component (TIGR02293 family)
MTAMAIAEVLGGPRKLKKKITSENDLIDATRKGFPIEVFSSLVKSWSFDKHELARAVGISARTLSRRISSHGRMSAHESDRAVRLAKVLAHAEDTFGERNRASQWLQVSNLALGGRRPFDLLDNDRGVELVDTILGRIDYGIYS